MGAGARRKQASVKEMPKRNCERQREQAEVNEKTKDEWQLYRMKAVVYIPKGKHSMFVEDFNSSKWEHGEKHENQKAQSLGLYH